VDLVCSWIHYSANLELTWVPVVCLCRLVLCGGGVTGPALNPARDLGPRIVHWLLPIPGKGTSEWWYAWVPVVAPCVGAVLGGLFNNAMKGMHPH
jgi:glycerol uptake facilitator protein